MNWIKTKISELKAKAKKIFKRQEKIDPSSSLWESCPGCRKLNAKDTLKENDYICETCNYYFDRPPLVIVKSFGLLDEKNFISTPTNLDDDPLNFSTDLGSYKDKLAKARKKEKQWCSILGYKGIVEDLKVHLVVSNFRFLGGSWSNNEAQYFQKIVDNAVENKSDVFIMMLKSGGVSMFHGALGLNATMGAGIIAMQKLKKNNILTIAGGGSKLTGGVLASIVYTSEIIVFEQNAHDITFAGKKISKNYLSAGEVMDEKFGSAEEKKATGQCDLVLERHNLKPVICTLAKIIKKKQNPAVINENTNNSTEQESREILPDTAKAI